MRTWRAEPVLAGIVTVATSAAAYGVESPSDTFPVLSAFAAAAFASSIAGLWYRQRWPRWRRVHVAFVWCSLVGLLATALLLRETHFAPSSLFTLIAVGWLLSSLGAFASGICVVPLDLANLLRGEPAPDEHEWTVDMKSTVEALHATFKDFSWAISRQHTDLKNAVGKVQERVESQRQAMKQVERKLADARSEIEQREAVAKLTPEHQQVLISTFSGRGRLKSYWRGFVSGLLAALVVELFRWGVGILFG